MIKVKEVKDYSLPELESRTFGLYEGDSQEPTIYISINSKNDEYLELKQNQLSIWNNQSGEIFNTNIEDIRGPIDHLQKLSLKDS